MRLRKPKMATISLEPRHHHPNYNHHHHNQYGTGGSVVEEIEGLIRVTKDGRVERPAIIPTLPCTPASASPHHVASHDIHIDKLTGLWARVYVPTASGSGGAALLPLVVYFHGGGFCVGSAAWGCYHEFLSALSSRCRCVVVSVDYRLAPESRLPAAYDDGLAALLWLRRQADGDCGGWLGRCDLAATFLAGDSAGANIAYHVSARLGPGAKVKGLVLIQPFFGGEARTPSERAAEAAPPSSAVLTVAAADAYWRMALPEGVGRDHPWCNPRGVAAGVGRVMVCVSEMDILRDRNMEFCRLAAGAGKSTRVDAFVYRGVGHAFQILHNNSHLALARTQEMLSHINAFIAYQ